MPGWCRESYPYGHNHLAIDNVHPDFCRRENDEEIGFCCSSPDRKQGHGHDSMVGLIPGTSQTRGADLLGSVIPEKGLVFTVS
jgi:hypothetical protein